MYPETVSENIAAALRRAACAEANAVGIAAATECGTYIKFTLAITDESRVVVRAAFLTNGCGYMVAAAETLARRLELARLTDLHGLRPADLISAVESELAAPPRDRVHCVRTVVDAVRGAFADYRRSRIEEFTGERAIICTCFGISEETVEAVIGAHPGADVDDVGRLTNAGTGCGSCRLLIDEMIDSADRDR